MKHTSSIKVSKRIRQINFENELSRKAIHLSSISIPIIYYHIQKEVALLILIPLFLGFFSVDFLKMHVKPLSRWYYSIFSSMLRPHELDEKKPHFNGATFVMFSACFTIAFFPKMIAIAAFTILIISDSIAALVGRKFGKHKIASKTLEGSAAFFISSMFIVFYTPNLDILAGTFMSFVATLAELFQIKFFKFTIDDNLTVPILGGLAAYAYYLLFLKDELPMLSLLLC